MRLCRERIPTVMHEEPKNSTENGHGRLEWAIESKYYARRDGAYCEDIRTRRCDEKIEKEESGARLKMRLTTPEAPTEASRPLQWMRLLSSWKAPIDGQTEDDKKLRSVVRIPSSAETGILSQPSAFFKAALSTKLSSVSFSMRSVLSGR